MESNNLSDKEKNDVLTIAKETNPKGSEKKRNKKSKKRNDQKKRKFTKEDEMKEKNLETFLFGSTNEDLMSDLKEKSVKEMIENSKDELQPAWSDLDTDNNNIEDELELEKNLRLDFEKISSGKNEWAKEINLLNQDEKKDFWFDKTTEALSNQSSSKIIGDNLSVKRISFNYRNKNPIISSIFHPNSQLLLISNHNHIELFKISLSRTSNKNEEQKSKSKTKNSRFPLVSNYKNKHGYSTVLFTPDGNEILCTNKNNASIKCYDLSSQAEKNFKNLRGFEKDFSDFSSFYISPNGEYYVILDREFGYVYLVSSKTKQVIEKMKARGSLLSACFSPSSDYLFTTSKEGSIYKWSLSERKCVSIFRDQGSLGTTSLDCSSQLMACGSNSGIVNVYSNESINQLQIDDEAKPLYKPIFNLRTSISGIKFNHDSQLFAFYSNQLDNSIRFAKSSTGKVFGDCFVNHQSLGITTSIGFSPNSALFVQGNKGGSVNLYRINNYNNY